MDDINCRYFDSFAGKEARGDMRRTRRQKQMVTVCFLALIPFIVAGCQQTSSGPSWSWYAWSTLATFFLGMVALFAVFYPTWKEYHDRPKLTIEFRPEAPDYIKIPIEAIHPVTGQSIQTIQAHWVRFRVSNKGKTAAENIEVFLSRVWKRTDEAYGEPLYFVPEERHIPSHLRWSVKQLHELPLEENGLFYPRVNREMDRSWNLCYIIDPQYYRLCPAEDPLPVLRDYYLEFQGVTISAHDREILETPAVILDTVWKPSSRSYILLKGHYMVEVVVASTNAKKELHHFDIIFDGTWDEDNFEMRREHLKVENVSEGEVSDRRARYREASGLHDW